MKKFYSSAAMLSAILFLMAGCAKKEGFGPKPETFSADEIMLVMPDCNNPVSSDLVAGQHTRVGSVQAKRTGNLVTVTYRIEDPVWSIREIHLAVGEIPVTKKGNPMVGRFGINEEYDAPVRTKTFEVEISHGGPVIPVAAHAVVWKNLALEGFNESLPEEKIDYQVVYPGESSYFSTYVSKDGETEMFPGWCIDTDNGIYSNTPYKAELVSTYELAGMGLVEFPENLDKVNWIINQDFVGTASICGGDFTFGDVQRSIWELLEDNQSTSGLADWDPCRVDEILAAALDIGSGFEPACEQEIALALVPFDENGDPVSAQVTITQITIIEQLLDCTQEYMEETAWGMGVPFNTRNWANLFYICND
jgi:hypothetical protein